MTLKAVFGLLTSRVGIIAMIALTLFAWHKLDKHSAVRAAVVKYVASVELTAAESEAAVLRTRIARLSAANEALETEIEKAEKESVDAEQIIRDYLAANEAPGDCRAGGPLLDLLRAD